MEKKFTSDEVPLSQILGEAAAGRLQLPDFQRGWVWDDDQIIGLLASISLSYPIGAVMTLQSGNPDVRFCTRPLEGVRLNNDVEPEMLLLDGQQRMTSLYLALRSGAPVPTKDAKKNDTTRRYFADIRRCIDPFSDREDAILSVPASGILRLFGGEVGMDVSTRAKQLANEMFPLDLVLDFPATMAWSLEYIQGGPGDQVERIAVWTRFNEAIVNAFVQYQVPTIQLVKSTPKEAVCQVFEKVNTGGVDLTVFELLTATYAADDFRLREDWADRKKRFEEHAVLADFSATDFLQVVTLLATYQRRGDHLAAKPDDDRTPPVSCKRKDILRLPLEDYQKWADIATDGVENIVPFLHGEHIFQAYDLPYATQRVPLAAIFAALGNEAESHGTRQLLRRWFWSGVFGEMYGGSTETRFAMDLQDLVAWVGNIEDVPRTIQTAQFQAERLLTLRSRLSAAYKGLYALQMKRGGRDFRTGETIDVHAYFDDAIDIHHIFPRGWCEKKGISRAVYDSVVNKTAIDRKTNQKIGGNAPSVYLKKIELADKIDAAELDAIIRSHDIDPLAVREDDFASFFNRRFERLVMQIEEAMGKPVNRRADRSESPFAQHDTSRDVIEAVRTLMTTPESKGFEKKSTARKNLHTGDRDPEMEWSVTKTIAAFMNATGGTLLIGVDDGGNLIGIENDYAFTGKNDQDSWELWLTGHIQNTLGKVAASEMIVTVANIEGHDVARIDVGPSPEPVFARSPKGEKLERFYARINNRTEELSGQDLFTYQKRRWPQ